MSDSDYDDEDEGLDLGVILTSLTLAIARTGEAVMQLAELVPDTPQNRKAKSEVNGKIMEARQALQEAFEGMVDEDEEDDA
jgi:hypothetical protein